MWPVLAHMPPMSKVLTFPASSVSRDVSARLHELIRFCGGDVRAFEFSLVFFRRCGFFAPRGKHSWFDTVRSPICESIYGAAMSGRLDSYAVERLCFSFMEPLGLLMGVESDRVVPSMWTMKDLIVNQGLSFWESGYRCAQYRIRRESMTHLCCPVIFSDISILMMMEFERVCSVVSEGGRVCL